MMYANILTDDSIALLDFKQRKAVKMFSMGKLKAKANSAMMARYGRPMAFDEVLNGIAYDAEIQVFYVTGKNSPLIFEI